MNDEVVNFDMTMTLSSRPPLKEVQQNRYDVCHLF